MNSQLRIVIDGRSLQGTRTGVGTCTANLLQQQLSLDPSIEITLAVSGSVDLPWLAASGRIRVVKIPLLSFNNLLWTNLSLASKLKPRSCDVFHSPGYTLPLWVSVPAALTVHDICYAANPDWYPYSNGAARRIWYRSSARKADCVLTPSEFSKREIVRLYGIRPEKIVVIPNGVDRRTFKKTESKELREYWQSKYGVRGDFLLFVGDMHRRRNLRRIIDAFEAVRNSGFPALELVLIGRFLDSSITASEIRSLPYGQSIHLPGYVPERDLVLFYSYARAFVFPSLYEGFGLGVLEAMACGCPVIVGRGTACEEVAGEAGILVDPTDTGSIAGAARGILENPDKAKKHTQSGLMQSERFSWRKAAEQTMLVYRQVAERRFQSVLENTPDRSK